MGALHGGEDQSSRCAATWRAAPARETTSPSTLARRLQGEREIAGEGTMDREIEASVDPDGGSRGARRVGIIIFIITLISFGYMDRGWNTMVRVIWRRSKRWG